MKDESMNEHVTIAELAAYVSDTADAEDTRRVEEHVASCARCAEALADEARIELALHEVVHQESATETALAREEVPAPEKPPLELLRAIEPTPPARALPRSRMPTVSLTALLVAAAAFVAVTYRSAHFAGGGSTSSRALPASERVASVATMRIECSASDDSARRACRHRARCAGELVEDGADGRDVPDYESLLAECKRAPGLVARQAR